MKRQIFINITPANSDVFISIKPGLFVKETKSVHKFMYGGSLFLTATPQRERLLPSTPTDRWTATVNEQMDYSVNPESP